MSGDDEHSCYLQISVLWWLAGNINGSQAKIYSPARGSGFCSCACKSASVRYWSASRACTAHSNACRTAPPAGRSTLVSAVLLHAHPPDAHHATPHYVVLLMHMSVTVDACLQQPCSADVSHRALCLELGWSAVAPACTFKSRSWLHPLTRMTQKFISAVRHTPHTLPHVPEQPAKLAKPRNDLLLWRREAVGKGKSKVAISIRAARHCLAADALAC